MKPLLVLIWLLVGVFYWWLHNDSQQVCCLDQTAVSNQIENDQTESTTIDMVDPNKVGEVIPEAPISFAFSSTNPIIGKGFEKMKDSLLNVLSENQIVEVNGLFLNREEYEGEFPNLGLERAENIKKILSQYIDESRIVTSSSKLKNGRQDASAPGIYSELALRVRTEEIVEIDDRTLIYFPYNSTKRLEDEEIEAYLDAVAERLERTGEKVYLTGHTDSFGDASYNYQLGLMRAKMIQRYLINKGIPSDKINVDSKGETSPIAPNNTETGRSKNRRTELVITE